MRFKKIFWQQKYTAIFFEIFSTEFSQIFLKNLEFTFFIYQNFIKELIYLIKLETNCANSREVFYFHNMSDCKDFLYVFKDHWCNVPWKTPIEIPDDTYITSKERVCMDKPPKKRAEDNLSWGFSLVRLLGIELNKNQSTFVSSFCSKS